MSLPELQYRLINALFDRKQRPAAAELVKTHGALDAAQRVGIYYNSVHGILLQYLQSLYPVCLQLLGDAFFTQASDRFVDQHPPTRPFLAEYGAGFADFLAQIPTLQTLPWLADVARLEWARQEAWHAVNQPAADFAQLATLAAEQQNDLRFQLPASAHLLDSAYAAHAVWLAHQAEDHPDKQALETIAIDQPSHTLIWRQKRSLRQVALSPEHAQFLHHIQQGTNLAGLAAEYGAQLPTLLTTAIQQGWLLSFAIPQISD